jgi:tRNA A-37 threonylcarbamoyl transferase component Bud32
VIGTVVGKYRIVGQLGRGAMGTVYRAVDETLYREVAIKVLNPDLIDTPIMKRFRSEATVLARLNHPVIATIYELVTADADTLIVMELVPGETLERICRRMGPMAPAHAAHIVDRILSALDHAHRAGVVHCDIKPSNIMVTAQGDVKIMDFGTARVPGKRQTTADKYMMGTPAYMPPEQVTGQSIDGRSDLYAVGVVFYRMLTGAQPFEADSLIGLMQKQISDEAPPLAAFREGLPDWCEPIVRRAMAKAPADRFQTAAEFSAALRSAGAVMRQPVGVARADPVSTAAAVERRDTRTQVLPTQSTVSTPIGAGARTIVKGGTIALPERPVARRDWRPIVVIAGSVVVALLVVWRFAGGSLQTTGASRLAERATVPPVQTATPAPVPPAPIVRETPKPAPTSTPRISAMPQPPVASIASPAARADIPASPPPAVIAPAPAPVPDKSAGKPAATPVVFEARLLTPVGDGPRERDCRVVLADGKIHVQALDNSATLFAVPYDDVLSISYSRGRDPLWNAPGGPEPVARAGAGALGIFRGTRHWLSLRTTNAKNRFLVLRLGNDEQAKRAIKLLEERTGRRSQLAGRGDGK